MCGRYILASPPEVLASHFELEEVPPYAARWNIAPTQVVPIVRETAGGTRECVLLRWGLIPSWSKDPSIGTRMINARAETLPDKPAYRTAFRRRRCLVPANGFYEWKQEAGKKQPYCFRLAGEPLFAMAGLWEHWTSPEGDTVQTFTIVTTGANDAVRAYHERMPVLIARPDYDEWLSSPNPGVLLAPWAGARFEIVPVSRRVNNVANDDESVLEPL